MLVEVATMVLVSAPYLRIKVVSVPSHEEHIIHHLGSVNFT